MTMTRLALLTAAAISVAAVAPAPAQADGMNKTRAYASADRCGGGGRFAGAYIGANIGMGQFSSQWADRDYYFYGQTEKVEERGLVYGGQAGYNMQCGMALYGIETDFNWANISTNDYYYASYGYPQITNDLNWFGTTRLRAGIVANNMMLLYVTGGLAYANIDHKIYYDGSYVGGSSGTKYGWTVGFGTEVAHWDRMTIKAEALYMDFGQDTYWDTGKSYRFDRDTSMWVARIGVNFKLGERDPLK